MVGTITQKEPLPRAVLGRSMKAHIARCEREQAHMERFGKGEEYWKTPYYRRSVMPSLVSWRRGDRDERSNIHDRRERVKRGITVLESGVGKKEESHV